MYAASASAWSAERTKASLKVSQQSPTAAGCRPLFLQHTPVLSAMAGVDEAGRGPLAGPVVAAACIIPAHVQISGIDDSKKLSAEQREHVYANLTTHPDVRWAT